MNNALFGLGLILMTAGIVFAGLGGAELANGRKDMCNGFTLAAMALIFGGAWLWKLS